MSTNNNASSALDALLDGLPFAEFSALLSEAAGRYPGANWVALADLGTGHEYTLRGASAPAENPLVAVARDLFADGDGQLYSAHVAGLGEDAFLAMRCGKTVWHGPARRPTAQINEAQLGRLNLRRLRQMRQTSVSSSAAALPASVQAGFSGSAMPAQPMAGEEAAVDAVLLDGGDWVWKFARVPFVPRLVIIVEFATPKLDAAPWHTADALRQIVLRRLIGLLLSRNFATQQTPFPQTEVEFDQIVQELRMLPADDLEARLDIGGFADHAVVGPDGPMRCSECIYFLPNRRWCDLPELPMPVEAEWYCRLWKL